MSRFFLHGFVLTAIALMAGLTHNAPAQNVGPNSDNPKITLPDPTPDPITFIGEQKVGLVLSGGGAKGLAHIGVIKALEENNIPIDYITGTSMGAIVGGMYAIGMPPQMMEALAITEGFSELAIGEIQDQYKYYFKKREPNASWLTLKAKKDTVWETSLPTSLINSVSIDFMMLEQYAGPEAAANYDFDSLFIPFRCVAADITSKKEVVFREGHLNEAVRASATFPFYLRPIRVKGQLMFDGGLYNNFPADVMYKEFYPDLIIGSNVAGNVAPPTEDNVLSQIKNMLVSSKTNFSVICENGILIEPDHNVGTFSFKDVASIIDSGYTATIRQMPEIKKAVQRRTTPEEITLKRAKFKDRQPEVLIDQIHVDGLNKRQSNYVKKIFASNKCEHTTLEEIKPVYFRVFQDDKIGTIFPKAEYNPYTKLYDLYLDINKAKEITLDLGGNLSNRPISGAYIGAEYNHLGHLSMSASANAYIGKLYSSAQIKSRIDFPIKLPFYLEPQFTFNRFDYFRSSTDFFDNVTPSYLVQKEKYGGLIIGFPVKNNGRVKVGTSIASLKDEYYQTKSFTKLDTADRTHFNVFTSHMTYERNTLNRKLYANEGSYTSLRVRYNTGEEYEVPGSTSIKKDPLSTDHRWLSLKLTSNTYYKRKGYIRLGFLFEAVYSTQNLFNNYTASILRAPAFQPTPESKTLFLESFRAHQYAALGQKVIFNIRKDVDLRLEGYIFQPYQSIIVKQDTVALGKEFEQFYTIAHASLVYHSYLGPISVSVNYYHNLPEIAQEDKTPFTFLFHFGYIIFNKRALE